MFISLCEFFAIYKYDEMNCNLVFWIFYNVFWSANYGYWNNHEYGVLMNGNVKCVENQGRNIECMHMKCKPIVTIVWNNFTRIKFHFYLCIFTLLLVKWFNSHQPFVIFFWIIFVTSSNLIIDSHDIN